MTQHVVATPQSPWHMWGSSQTLSLTVPALSGPGTTLFPDPQQIFRTNYRRPDTWSFFFYATLLGGTGANVNVDTIVNFNVIDGVGRTSFDTAGVFGSSTAFCEFRFRVLGGAAVGLRKKWTTRVNSPPLDDTAVATSVQLIDSLPGEDLQCSARAAIVIAGANVNDVTMNLEIGGWVAPRTHIRPDWYQQPRSDEELENIRYMQFLANEFGGT